MGQQEQSKYVRIPRELTEEQIERLVDIGGEVYDAVLEAALGENHQPRNGSYELYKAWLKEFAATE